MSVASPPVRQRPQRRPAERSLQPLRVVLIDDHPMFAEALASYLDSQPDFAVVARIASGERIPGGAGPAPDLALIGVTGATGAGLAQVRDVLLKYPQMVVAVLSDAAGSADDAQVVIQAIRLGVAAWVSKSEPADRLLDILRQLKPGDCHLPPALLGRVVRASMAGHRATEAGPLAVLTPREREVLQHLVNGSERAEIAARLFLSPNTVRTHTQNLLGKLSVHSVLEAVAVGLRSGLRPAAD